MFLSYNFYNHLIINWLQLKLITVELLNLEFEPHKLDINYRLTLQNPDSQQVEVTPLCVLDFYVNESRQRQGHGYKLFSFMMEVDTIPVTQIFITIVYDEFSFLFP